MRYKIKNTEYKISFSFLCLLLLVICEKNLNIYLITVVAAIIHEAIHLLFIYKLSIPPECVSLSIFGADIKRGSAISTSPLNEFFINICAPIFNLFIALILFLFKIKFKFLWITENLIYVNLILGVFNILPFYSFDGGNALKSLLLMKFTEELTEKIITVSSVCVITIISSFAVIVFYNYRSNLSLVFLCIYLTFCLIFKK